MSWKPWPIPASKAKQLSHQTLQRLTFFLIAILLLLGMTGSVRADGGSPDESYLITPDGRRVPAPLGYTFSTRVGSGFNKPQDLFADSATGHLLVADTGNNRILVLDAQGAQLFEISQKREGLKNPEGVFVDLDGNIWVADTGNNRVAVFDSKGEFKAEYLKPQSDLLSEYDFSPRKIVVDRRGFIFTVTGSQDNLGVLVMDTSGRFRGFFGRARVPFNLTRFLSNLFATDAQRLRMEKIKPDPLGNIHLDADGFIYATSPVLNLDQIQRLNAVGENVYGSGLHTGAGRLLDKLSGGEGQAFGECAANSCSQFIDVAVDGKLGVVSALDLNTSQIYQYDQSGNLLTIFGGKGQRAGMFAMPSSLAAGADGTLYILDEGRGDIEIFAPTAIMRQIHQATYEYYTGNYQQASALWNDIAAHNTNFTLAHSGLGKALLRQEHYADAMTQYRLADDQGGYSAAFQEYRYAWLREHFGLAGLSVAGFLLATALWGKPLGRFIQRTRTASQRAIEQADLWAVPVLLALAIGAWMLSLNVTSFHFRTQRPEQTRLLFESGKILLPWLTWCISSLGISQIFFGRGTFKQIVLASAKALIPLILFAVPLGLVTNMLSLGEAGLVEWGWYAIWALVAWQFFLQGELLHSFDFGEAVLVFVLNIFGILVIWALAALAYTLTADIVRFIGQILLEIYVRRF